MNLKRVYGKMKNKGYKVLKTDGRWTRFDENGFKITKRKSNSPFKVLGVKGSWRYFNSNNKEISKGEYDEQYYSI
jgi:hypothetical protein